MSKAEAEPAEAMAADALPLDASLQTFLTAQLERTSRTSLTDIPESAGPQVAEEPEEAAAAAESILRLRACQPSGPAAARLF